MQLSRRRKTLLACNQCRDRKTRCDGDRPICRFCQERHLQCRYENGLRKSLSSHSGIERRLRLLEQQSPRRDRWAVLDGTPQPCPPDPRPDVSTQNSGVRPESNQVSLKYGSPNQPFYGSSSSDSFLSQVSSITYTLTQQQRWLNNTSSPHSESETSPSQPCNLQIISSFLPEPDVALTLMECFWENIHPIFPLLHRPSLLQAYALLRESQEAETGDNAQEKIISRAILNVVFALGIQYDNQLPFEHRVISADAFYQRSLSFVPLGTVDHPTQSHVQFFLLTAIYLHSTPYANRCWDMIGIGLRVAIGLGLYRENSSFHGKESQLKREMRRRIWFCCVVLDKMSAATFGRPATLPGSWKLLQPRVIDDEFLQCVGEGSQPPGLPSYIEGFVYSLGIFKILEDVLDAAYNLLRNEDDDDQGNQDGKFEQMLAKTVVLNSRLDDLVEKMPNHLRIIRSSPGTPANSSRGCRVQAQTLHCRVHYVRLLILRPWLLENIHSATQLSVDQNTLQEIRSLCISTAQQTIYIIYDSEIDHPQKSSWHAVYFLHAAASILLAAALHPKGSGGIDLTSEPYQTSWQMGIQTLRGNKVQLQACENVVDKLESCREKIREAQIGGAGENLSVQDAADLAGAPSADTSFDWDLDCLSTEIFLDPKPAY